MFQELLSKAKANIITVRSIIKTNENLRRIISSRPDKQFQKSNDYLKLLKEIKQDVPEMTEWRIYDHCAAVTKLYAIYENFVEDSIREWLGSLPQLYLNYTDLDERVRNTHKVGVGRLLLDLNKNRYEHLAIEDVVSGLYSGINNKTNYELLPDAFLFHEQNLRREILDKLLSDAGILNSWTWINKHKSIKNFVEEVKGSQNTAEGELNELISYRNEAAHGALIDDFLRANALLELCDFIESLCQSLNDLFVYQVIQKKAENGEATKIGKITEWFTKPEAGVAKVSNAKLCVKCNLYLINQNLSWCQSVTIDSIKVEDNSVEEISADNEMEVGLKFNVDAREGLDLYLLKTN
ncbi:MAG: MAE_28990/MAE_18760 family HEPN-like nuclease [Cyanobacteria bacterium P01_G01_bin.19]